MDHELQDWEVEALLNEEDDLSDLIDDAAEDAKAQQLRQREAAILARMTAYREGIERDRAMATKCVKIALQARSKGRVDLAAAARDKEQTYLQAIATAHRELPRLESALGRLRRVINVMGG